MEFYECAAHVTLIFGVSNDQCKELGMYNHIIVQDCVMVKPLGCTSVTASATKGLDHIVNSATKPGSHC